MNRATLGIKISVLAIAIALTLQALTIALNYVTVPFWRDVASGTAFIYCIGAAIFLIKTAIKIK